MSFSLNIKNLSPEKIAFNYSAAHETLLALHVFSDCKHHPLHIPWVIQARKKISPALKQEIEAFSIFYQRPIVTFWGLQECPAVMSFDEELNKLALASSDYFCKTLVETILKRIDSNIFKDEKLQQEFIIYTSSHYPQSADMVSHLLKEPGEVQQRFITMLENFWSTCMKNDWSRIEDLLLKDIACRGKTLRREGPLELLNSLSPEIDIYPKEQRALIRRITKEEIIFGKEDWVFLAPSYFAWPHLFVNLQPFGINYSIGENLEEAATPIPPEDLLKFFKALGDFTRLQIIQYLAKKPRSTRELAALIGVTEGAISKHLKQLGDAGIITSKRESYYVFYHLQKHILNDYPRGLSQFIK